MIPLSCDKEHSVPTILFITGEATSSVDAGAVVGGTVAGVIALIVLVIPLLGCLIYNKKRKRRLHIRYVVIQYTSECFIAVCGAPKELCQSMTFKSYSFCFQCS